MTELLDLLNDPATKAAFEQHADLAEQIWKRLRPAGGDVDRFSRATQGRCQGLGVLSMCPVYR